MEDNRRKKNREREEDQLTKSKAEYLYFTNQYQQCVDLMTQLVDKENQKKLKSRNQVLLKDYYETIVRCLLVCKHTAFILYL
jgi:hypothetical protein